jgi:hypothetical protein
MNESPDVGFIYEVLDIPNVLFICAQMCLCDEDAYGIVHADSKGG